MPTSPAKWPQFVGAAATIVIAVGSSLIMNYAQVNVNSERIDKLEEFKRDQVKINDVQTARLNDTYLMVYKEIQKIQVDVTEIKVSIARNERR